MGNKLLTPPGQDWLEYRNERVRAAGCRRGIDGLIGKITDRAKYLTDEQRQKLRDLAGDVGPLSADPAEVAASEN